MEHIRFAPPRSTPSLSLPTSENELPDFRPHVFRQRQVDDFDCLNFSGRDIKYVRKNFNFIPTILGYSLCSQLTPFTYFPHITSRLISRGREILYVRKNLHPLFVPLQSTPSLPHIIIFHNMRSLASGRSCTLGIFVLRQGDLIRHPAFHSDHPAFLGNSQKKELKKNFTTQQKKPFCQSP